MSSEGSVSQWMKRLQEAPDDSEAQHVLFTRYLCEAVALARSRLRGSPQQMADEEDVALRALHDLFTGIRDARFSKLNDRDDLWQVLSMLVRRRAIDQRRRCEPRGELRIQSLGGADSSSPGMEQVPDDDIPPHLWVQMQEEMARRIEQLDRPEYAKFCLQTVAILKLEGRTNTQIAEHLGCVERTVERRLEMIRAIWSESDESGAKRASS